MKRSLIQVGRVYIRRAPSSRYNDRNPVLVLDTAGYNKANDWSNTPVPTGDKTGYGILALPLRASCEKNVYTPAEVKAFIDEGKGQFVSTNSIYELYPDEACEANKKERLDMEARAAEEELEKQRHQDMWKDVVSRAQFLGIGDEIVTTGNQRNCEKYGYSDVTISLSTLANLLSAAMFPGLTSVKGELLIGEGDATDNTSVSE